MNEEKFKPTTEWMSYNYDILNDDLFNGVLGKCNFVVKNSGTRRLGWFKLDNPNLRYYPRNMRLFIHDYPYDKIIRYDNFYSLANPEIGLNSSYIATENGWLGTLVHEMCHYYTYMHGIVPKQGHGIEFRRIAETVSSRSNGVFTVTRLADAEVLKGFDLNDDALHAIKKRMHGSYTVVVLRKNGSVELTITKNYDLVKYICDYVKAHPQNRSGALHICVTNENSIIDFLCEHGYQKIMRSYRFFTVTENDVKEELLNFNYDFVENISSEAEAHSIMNESDNISDNNKVVRISDIDLGQYSPYELQ